MRADLLVPMVPFAFALAALAIFGLRRYVARRREGERVRRENLERQEFLIARMESMRKLFANPDIPIAELKERQNRLLAEMESRNVDGNLDPLIADTALYLQEEFHKLDAR